MYKTDIQKINDRLLSDFNLLTSMGYEVVGVFLQGSQNYHLDYEGSDIDTKAIVVPGLSDIILNKPPVSTTHVLPTDEHIDIKDIRLMFDCFKKQNINFVEILFTKYKFMNPKYEKLYQPMFDNAERIAHYNNYAAINCIAGMVYEKYKALEHPYPATVDKIEKYGYDAKQLHHMLRCEEFLKRYINGVPYRECLISLEPSVLIKIKSEYPYSLTQARSIAANVEYIVKDVKQKYMDTHEISIDKEVVDIMNKVLLDICSHRLKSDIMEANNDLN